MSNFVSWRVCNGETQKEEQARTARKRARDQVKEKGVYVRQVTDTEIVYDVTVSASSNTWKLQES